MKNIIAVLSMCALMAGCGTLRERPAAAQLVTQFAVLKYAERFEEGARAERMGRIRSIATTVKGLAEGETTLPLLQAAVASQLDKAGLSPADRLLADGLVQLIAQELQSRIGAGVLSPEQLVAVRKVMDWIVSAATISAPSAP